MEMEPQMNANEGDWTQETDTACVQGPNEAGIPPTAGLLLLGLIEALQRPLFPEEAQPVQGAIEKRYREFCAGRTLAREALRRLGTDGRQRIPATDDRTPAWPAGFTGAITHTHGFCGCAVARTEAVRAVGIDMETCGRVKPNLWSRLFTEEEQKALLDLADDQRDVIATAMFCAKESYYKLQYGLTRTWLNFVDVSVLPGVPGHLTVVAAAGTPAAAVVPRLEGYYSVPFPNTVLCQCWLMNPSARPS